MRPSFEKNGSALFAFAKCRISEDVSQNVSQRKDILGRQGARQVFAARQVMRQKERYTTVLLSSGKVWVDSWRVRACEKSAEPRRSHESDAYICRTPLYGVLVHWQREDVILKTITPLNVYWAKEKITSSNIVSFR
jgi:hypothetical protein